MYYNRRRRHSANGWKSPAEYETEWHKMPKAA
jgi:transposase InsO family protein